MRLSELSNILKSLGCEIHPDTRDYVIASGSKKILFLIKRNLNSGHFVKCPISFYSSEDPEVPLNLQSTIQNALLLTKDWKKKEESV
ncbi:hypothetical protein LEP1GSC062_4302 [Leptospira alexanderi serovar Manhao 3 str. L 60]|uniref:Uncharacterized protein n=1 Tax=Leptospira alexanderi serovar Manhao 3 str. L 60 TaxID=1049759 RepID=V6IBG6_9LEPT|nr:hypothetical protein LEP1GSC062_4302 [Leptospira alexanderi serovar Manhao 3 str. L 60]